MLRKFFFGQHLSEDERILIVVHKHWLLGIKSLWAPSIVFALTWGILYFVHTPMVVYSVALAATGVGIWWIRNFLDYYLDAWVVTDHGVIDLEWHGWFHRTSARVLYSDIQGVEYEVKGIAGTLFGYGVITLEKISTGGSISMPYVKKPRKVEIVILKGMEAYMHRKNLKDAKTVQNILAEFVASSMQKQAAEENVKKLVPKKAVIKKAL